MHILMYVYTLNYKKKKKLFSFVNVIGNIFRFFKTKQIMNGNMKCVS